MKNWIFLAAAIVSEVAGTLSLKQTDGFSKFLPSVMVVLFYGVSFYFLSLTLRVIPVGVAYAIWAGLGISLIALAGWLWFGQKLDAPAILGIVLIVCGVAIMRIFSQTAGG